MDLLGKLTRIRLMSRHRVLSYNQRIASAVAGAWLAMGNLIHCFVCFIAPVFFSVPSNDGNAMQGVLIEISQ